MSQTTCRFDQPFNRSVGCILDNREWSLQLSFNKRCCYLSGKNLWFKLAYRGRKKIWSIIDNGRQMNDDIWLSDIEYHNMIRKGNINV
jgi:hypothetical protein